MAIVCPKARGSSRWLLAVLLALGSTLGCGGAEDEALDPALGGVSAAIRGGVAPCQRRALCVPENPCHLGQVTGCRANVPICSDTGAWLPNGTSCGEDCVCLRGEPNFCDAGAACYPPDPWGQPDRCQLGTTVCTTGRPVCVSQGTAPDGTSCADGPYVCRGGVCGWCQDGDYCDLGPGTGQECVQGVVQSCSTGGTCVAGGLKPNGTWCNGELGVGACLDGACNACQWGASCDAGNECVVGYTDCSSGNAACQPWYYQPDGTPCGGDGMCWSGLCGAACTGGEYCKPTESPCWWGYTQCSASGASCPAWYLEPDGTPCPGGSCQWGSCVATCSASPNGTPCGVDQFCSGGTCTQCGTPCPTGDLCATPAALSCTTGLCEPTGSPPGDGASCGPAGETCAGGFCKGAAGSPLIVRTVTGTMNVADTAWSACYWDEPYAGMSRRAVDGFGATTFSHADIVFPFSTECMGPTAQSLGLLATGSAYTEGDRLVGWTPGAPSGLPPTVTTTATYLYGFTELGDITSMKALFFIDDRTPPFALYTGESKNTPTAPDGYPTVLSAQARTQLPACTAGGACQGMGGTCRTWSLECDYLAAACLETGTAPDGTSCGNAGELCVGGVCTGPAASAWIVRDSSGGYTDITGMTFSSCANGEPEPWMSRRKTSVMYAGGVTAIEDVYPSIDCLGDPDPLQHWQADFAMVIGGDRYSGWSGPYPYWLPPTFWATGIELSGTGPDGPFVAKDTVLLDLSTTPWRLYTGWDDNPILLDAEGYPAYLLEWPAFRQ